MHKKTYNFYELVEIAVKLNAIIEENRYIQTPEGKLRLQKWHQKLKMWLITNFEDPGIDKNEEKHLLSAFEINKTTKKWNTKELQN